MGLVFFTHAAASDEMLYAPDRSRWRHRDCVKDLFTVHRHGCFLLCVCLCLTDLMMLLESDAGTCLHPASKLKLFNRFILDESSVHSEPLRSTANSFSPPAKRSVYSVPGTLSMDVHLTICCEVFEHSENNQRNVLNWSHWAYPADALCWAGLRLEHDTAFTIWTIYKH